MDAPSPPQLAARLRAAGSVFAQDEAALLLEHAASPEDLELLVSRRLAGAPLQHVLGWADFLGCRILLTPDVFVPRPRTEFLVELARRRLHPGDIVVDLCCGSGAIGVAVVAHLEDVELHAADIEPAAVRCARRNVEAVGGRVHQGDLYAALPPGLRGRVTLLTANAPYVPTRDIDTMPQEARDHEPRITLDGGRDGLDVQRRVIASAAQWLAPGGTLLVETSAEQAAGSLQLATQGGLTARIERCPDLDATVLVATAGP